MTAALSSSHTDAAPDDGVSMDEIHTPLLVDVDPSRNLNDLLAERLRSQPDAALVERRSADGSRWDAMSTRQFDAAVVAVAQGLVARGVAPGDRVGIMSRTRYEWTLLDWAIWAAGAVPIPLYETSSAEQVHWILTDSAVSVLVVETAQHAAAVASVRAETPDLRDVLVLDEGAVDTLVADGAGIPEEE